jgi:uncharacterized protein (DUF697 family)
VPGKDAGRMETNRKIEELKDEIKRKLDDAKLDYKEVGGWASLKSGEWLWEIIQKSFANYSEKANVEYFESKYGTEDKEKLANKLIAVAAKNSAILGGVTGAYISIDEIVSFVTGAEFGVGLPVNLAFAAAGLGAEVILLTRVQLQLVANLGRLFGVPLDPDDPEDILTILGFSLGGSVAGAAGEHGMRIGGRLAEAALERFSAKLGIKMFQRSIVKYIVPVASVGIGTGWNYASTRVVGRIAVKHFKLRSNEVGSDRKAA